MAIRRNARRRSGARSYTLPLLWGPGSTPLAPHGAWFYVLRPPRPSPKDFVLALRLLRPSLKGLVTFAEEVDVTPIADALGFLDVTLSEARAL